MEYVYMGIFSKIFNWVLDKIFAPVFDFLAKILSSALSWIFNKVLGPLLEHVLWPLIKATLDLILKVLAGVLFAVFAQILKILDQLNQCFDYLIGLSNVSYKGQEMSLLEAMFQVEGLRNAFLLISCLGLTIALMLAIYATARSAFDLDFENRRPVSRVLTALFKAFINLFTVELVVMFLVRLSQAVLQGLSLSLSYIGNKAGTSTTLGRMVFTVASMNACLDKKLNLNSGGAVGINDRVRSKFYYLSGNMDYTNSDVVKEYFDLAGFDYVIGMLLAGFLVVIMASCLVIFVQRLFDMLLLYLVSPLFVGMMPLDDGERFGKWRELFIGKAFSGFGMVVAMKMYVMLCPVIMGSDIQFSRTSTELDYMTKMVFLLGGAWAVLKSGSTITSLLSAQAGSTEAETASVASGAVVGAGIAAVHLAGGLAGAGITALAGKAGEARGRSNQKFQDTKAPGRAGGIPGLSGGSGTDSGGGASGGSGIGSGGSASGGSGIGSDGGGSGPFTGSGGSGGPGAGSIPGVSGDGGGSGAFTGLGGRGSPGAGSLPGSSGAGGVSGSREPGKNRSLAPGQISKGLLFRTYRRPDGSRGVSFKPGGGKLFNIGKDGKGNFNFKLAGFGVRVGADGKVDKVHIPCLSWKKGADGMHFNKAWLPVGLGTWKHSNKTGTMKFKSMDLLGIRTGHTADGTAYVKKAGVIGYKGEMSGGEGKMTSLFGGFLSREKGNDGEYHWTNMGGLFRQEKQQDGQYHMTSALFGAVQSSHTVNDQGNSELAGLRLCGMNFYIREDVAEAGRARREAGKETQ